MKKKALSLLLALVMCLGLFPMSAAAAYELPCWADYPVDVVDVEYDDSIVDERTPVRILIKDIDGTEHWENVRDANGRLLYFRNEYSDVYSHVWYALKTQLSLAERKSKMEADYGINIKFDSIFTEEFQLSFLINLDEAFQKIPAKMREGVRSKLASRGKKLTVNFPLENFVGGELANEYNSSTTTISLLAETYAFFHEYGHLVHREILNYQYGTNALESKWTALNNGIPYGSHDWNRDYFFDGYAASKYTEDIAMTFHYLFNGYDFGDKPVAKKVNYLRQLLCDTFSITPSDFPPVIYSTSSPWAEEAIKEYRNDLYDYSCGGVIDPYEPSYRNKATRLAFANSICYELVDHLMHGPEYSGRKKYNRECYFSNQSLAAEKWGDMSSDSVLIKGKEIQSTRTMPFSDMYIGGIYGVGDCYSVYILNKNGVINGTSATTFDPEGSLTRQEAATILYRLCDALDYELPKGELTFADADRVAPWAQEAVAAISAAGIMNGVGDNRFDPTGTYTNEQCAATLLRVYKMLMESGQSK